MNASSTLPSSSPISPRPSSPVEALPVPARWRAGQFTIIALIALAAVAYFKFVWSLPTTPDKSPADFLGFLVLGGLAWLTSPTAGTIATSTLQEALRRRWVIGFLAFSIVVILFSGSLTFVQLGEEQRFLQDFGTGFIIAMTILIAIFLGVTLVPPEIERRTILTILSKPVNRAEFLVGKFLGLCLTLLFCLFVLSTIFLLTFVIFNLRQSPNALATGTANNPDATLVFQTLNLAKALLLHYGQLVVLASLSLMLSLIVTPITAITFCFLAYFGGQMSSYWGHLGQDDHGDSGAHGLSGPMQRVVQFVYYALPRMDRFDVRQQLVTDTPVATSTIWKAWSSGLVYVAVLLLIGYLVFSDREF